MNREEYINHIEQDIVKYYSKCKRSRIEFIKTYYLGILYKLQETYRRLTGETYVDISKAYFR